ncbi:protein of unknown function [Chishuiella changwenlii]|uniref:DUF4861 domain-containing protein n=1 Tax=Chishuiella changwenlii TaxID=1434701 RepID=A0A1M7C3E5_9FLAO|nr:DUF4861 family protein [Chishuiella changwenlii]GGF05730.1 hypothetical protein GCM10010984_23740 [Chishuiella changwenlii]SHL61744.1 protein of unknown function [Chishuiella changwenlii]
MKNLKYCIVLAAFSILSCNKQNQSSVEAQNGLTYSEISVKEGGQWVDGKRGHKEYVGGTFKNVQELSLDPNHTDHSFDIRYEGPGWENQNVAFRLYLDWRNAVDIYGKKVKTSVLKEVGQDGFDSYHNAQPWGQDILKSGKALGIGGFGRLINGEVAHLNDVKDTHVKVYNEKKSSGYEINYTQWKTENHVTDVKANVSIFPYDRFSKFELKTSANTDGLCTGIVKFKEIPLQKKKSEDGSWGYIATYGAQTLVSKTDLLGMAIFYKTSEVDNLVDGQHDHLIVFKPTTKTVTYYILAAWEQEPDGINNEKDFYNDLNVKLTQLQKNNRL